MTISQTFAVSAVVSALVFIGSGDAYFAVCALAAVILMVLSAIREATFR